MLHPYLHRSKKKSDQESETNQQWVLHHKPDSEGNQLLVGVRETGMTMVFMVIALHVMDMVIELWIAGSLPEVMLAGPTPRLDVGHVACLAMLLLYVTP